MNASPLVGVKPFCTVTVIAPASEARPETLIWSYGPGVVPPRLIARLLEGVCVSVVGAVTDWMVILPRLAVAFSTSVCDTSVLASTYGALAAGATGVLAGAAATGIET